MFLRKVLGGFISKIIMPSQLKYADQTRNQLNYFLAQYGGLIRFQNISTTMESQAALFEYSNDNRIGKDTKVILHTYGNGDCAENHLQELVEMGKENPNMVIAGMNFRNVASSGASPVHSEQDWIDDILRVVEHYRKKGISLNNILLNGHSLGGAIATMAAAQLYQQELKKAGKSETDLSAQQKLEYSPRLLNNRSFSSLADEIMISLLKGSGTGMIAATLFASVAAIFATTTVAGAIAAGILTVGVVYPQAVEFFVRPFLNALLWTVFGTMNAFNAYQALPEGAKDYVIAKDDAVILERATIHHQLKTQRKAQKQKLKEIVMSDKKCPLVQKRDALSALLNIKDCKLVFADDGKLSLEAHNNSLSLLKTKHQVRKLKVPLCEAIMGDDVQVTGAYVLNQKIQKLLR